MALTLQRRLRAVNWLLAALFVAAALRGLVPGMCATLSAMQAASSRDSVATCCMTAIAHSEDGEGPAYAAVDAERSPCAFCHLAFARSLQVTVMAVAAPTGLLADDLPTPSIGTPKSRIAAGASLGRAPPARLS